MSGDGDETPRAAMKKALVPVVVAGIIAAASWAWGGVKEGVELKAQNAALAAELAVHKRQAEVCRDITEQATRLIARVREDDKK